MQGLKDDPRRSQDTPSMELQETSAADQLRDFTFAARSRQLCHSSMYPRPGFNDVTLWGVFSRNIAEQFGKMVGLAAAMLARASTPGEKTEVRAQLEQIIKSVAGDSRDEQFLAKFWEAVGASQVVGDI